MISENNKPAFKTLFIGSDHAGIELKQQLMGKFPFLPWKDVGTFSTESVDYPDFAEAVCKSLQTNLADCRGILICGSGQGMTIKANRYPFIRAALCWNEEVTIATRQHNDANVLCLGARFVPPALAERILNAFLTTPFEGGRHSRRIEKL